ncbi:MAG TPA: tRNA (adenosine(37)-N6)-threonylcarbamoyltransferase complex transferase subunit TsaD [Flavisolibacter sp.]
MPVILAIESSCDETAASICRDGNILSNQVATQAIHRKFGGVVPELASRAHMQHIIPVVNAALKDAGVSLPDIDAVAFTRAPGLIGSLLVGSQFAKSLSLALDRPLIEVHHMQAHVLANLIPDANPQGIPTFPFLCLTVSGGHTQIVLAAGPNDMQVIGETLDDAAGEAFDKTAKLLGLPYPGGPLIDKFAAQGDATRFRFAEPRIEGLDFSFSGLKTSILYFLQKETAADPDFVEKNMADICASVQHTIISILLKKMKAAALRHGITDLCIAGGVSANSGLRRAFTEMCAYERWRAFIPKFEYCTDNAAMIAITGYYKFLANEFSDLSVTASARAGWS